jgi:hypothetical protein
MRVGHLRCRGYSPMSDSTSRRVASHRTSAICRLSPAPPPEPGRRARRRRRQMRSRPYPAAAQEAAQAFIACLHLLPLVTVPSPAAAASDGPAIVRASRSGQAACAPAAAPAPWPSVALMMLQVSSTIASIICRYSRIAAVDGVADVGGQSGLVIDGRRLRHRNDGVDLLERRRVRYGAAGSVTGLSMVVGAFSRAAIAG